MLKSKYLVTADYRYNLVKEGKTKVSRQLYKIYEYAGRFILDLYLNKLPGVPNTFSFNSLERAENFLLAREFYIKV